jgi:hypothetical protein
MRVVCHGVKMLSVIHTVLCKSRRKAVEEGLIQLTSTMCQSICAPQSIEQWLLDRFVVSQASNIQRPLSRSVESILIFLRASDDISSEGFRCRLIIVRMGLKNGDSGATENLKPR